MFTVLVAFDVEKFSGWLIKEEGFEDVAQLHGGIATYGKDPETKTMWDGKMYVFDDHYQ